jgi:hypothetical protein
MMLSWFIRFLTDSPGGLFGVVIGTLTLVGTFVAIQSILEMKHTITSYQQLLERVTELVENTHDQVDGIKIVCYTPQPGFWQVTSKSVKRNFIEKLKDSSKKIQIICLEEETHIKLLMTIARIRYNDNGNKISPLKLLEFQRDCDELLTNFKEKEDFNSDIILMPWDDLPPYYFFVSAHKAIVVTPVGLPPIDSTISDDLCRKIAQYKIPLQINNNKNKNEYLDLVQLIEDEMRIESYTVLKARTKTNHAKVNTLGFETNDRTIIDSLQKLFDALKTESEKNYTNDKNNLDKILTSL